MSDDQPKREDKELSEEREWERGHFFRLEYVSKNGNTVELNSS